MTDFPRHTIEPFRWTTITIVLWLKIFGERSFQQSRLAHVGYSKYPIIRKYFVHFLAVVSRAAVRVAAHMTYTALD